MNSQSRPAGSLGCIVLGCAIVIALILVVASPTGGSGLAFGSGLNLIFWAAIFAGICRIAKPMANWGREQNAAYWFCFAVALVLCFSGLIDPQGIAWMALEGFWEGGFYVLEAVASRLETENFVMAFLFWLPLTVVLWAIFMILMIPIAAVAGILRAIAESGEVGLVLNRLVYSAMLASALRRLVFPPIELLLRGIWPAAAAIVNDIFIALPDDAAERIIDNGRVEIRVRRKFELFIALVAAALAIASYFLRKH